MLIGKMELKRHGVKTEEPTVVLSFHLIDLLIKNSYLLDSEGRAKIGHLTR